METFDEPDGRKKRDVSLLLGIDDSVKKIPKCGSLGSFEEVEYQAHVADIDGNLTPTHGYHSTLSEEILDRIINKISEGIPFGICSARSSNEVGTIKEQILNRFERLKDKSLIQNFYLFPENGSKVVHFEYNGKSIVEYNFDLIEFFAQLQTTDQTDIDFKKISKISPKEMKTVQDLLCCKCEEMKSFTYSIRVDIARDDFISDQDYKKQVTEKTKHTNFLLGNLGFAAFCTRSTISIAKKGVNKGLSLKFLSYLYDIPIEKIVGTDDQCEKTGVGYTLTSHAAGVSTNFSEEDSTSLAPLNVARISGKTGDSAWIFLDNILKYTAPKNKFAAILKKLLILNKNKFSRGVISA